MLTLSKELKQQAFEIASVAKNATLGPLVGIEPAALRFRYSALTELQIYIYIRAIINDKKNIVLIWSSDDAPFSILRVISDINIILVNLLDSDWLKTVRIKH
jgi:hypothetical protein